MHTLRPRGTDVILPVLPDPADHEAPGRPQRGAGHGVGRDVVVREAKEAGYKLVEQEPRHSFGIDVISETWELTL